VPALRLDPSFPAPEARHTLAQRVSAGVAGRPKNKKSVLGEAGTQLPTSTTIRYNNGPVKEKDLLVMANSNLLNRAWFLATSHCLSPATDRWTCVCHSQGAREKAGCKLVPGVGVELRRVLQTNKLFILSGNRTSKIDEISQCGHAKNGGKAVPLETDYFRYATASCGAASSSPCQRPVR
jgi:hypothetical protein